MSQLKTHKIKWEKVFPYFLLLPAFMLVCLFKLYPMVAALIRSLFVKGSFTVEVYELLFRDTQFWSSLWVTIKMNLIMIPLQVVISFLLALLVNLSIKGIGVFRSIYYLPVTISIAVTAVIWKMMLNYNSGFANSLLMNFGVAKQGFFNDAKQALWCCVLLATWKGCGFWMMYFLAGLKGIDVSIYESARVDGASRWMTLKKITIPLLKRTTLFVLVANTSVNLLLFAPMKIITEGGPNNSTNVLMYEAYKSAFKYGNTPRAFAIVTIMIAIILAVVIVEFKMMNADD